MNEEVGGSGESLQEQEEASSEKEVKAKNKFFNIWTLIIGLCSLVLVADQYGLVPQKNSAMTGHVVGATSFAQKGDSEESVWVKLMSLLR